MLVLVAAGLILHVSMIAWRIAVPVQAQLVADNVVLEISI